MRTLTSLVLMFSLLSGCDSNSLNSLKKYGENQFSTKSWLSSNSEERSKMVYSFLTKNDITQLNTSELYKLLGSSTGYYEYDEFPAYIIKSENKEYTLAFPVNRKTMKIRTYVITP